MSGTCIGMKMGACCFAVILRVVRHRAQCARLSKLSGRLSETGSLPVTLPLPQADYVSAMFDCQGL